MGANSEDYEAYLRTAVLIAKKAGQVVSSVLGDPNKEVSSKSGETDVVTETDKAVENLIRDELSASYPQHGFIGEESEFEKGLMSMDDRPTWIVDPIDGTLNFVHCNHLVAISIGLVIKKRIVLGVIYVPMRSDVYTAIVGRGAFKNGVPIRVSKVKNLEKAMITYEVWARSKDQHKEHQLSTLSVLCSKVMAIRSYGSACINLCLLAEGQIDVYMGSGIRVWDMAAGAIIVQEAGGTLLHNDGSEFDAMSRNILAASSSSLAKELIGLHLKLPQMKRDHEIRIHL
uniref:Inositol-1-monophosphatase n=1 Tax=Caligus rogercresseyi TaxID=217165 RepID=C1BN72_CALRO|nr:Inositol monophosphatase ttx-7 [Caligus rogercresseyi]